MSSVLAPAPPSFNVSVPLPALSVPMIVEPVFRVTWSSPLPIETLPVTVPLLVNVSAVLANTMALAPVPVTMPELTSVAPVPLLVN